MGHLSAFVLISYVGPQLALKGLYGDLSIVSPYFKEL